MFTVARCDDVVVVSRVICILIRLIVLSQVGRYIFTIHVSRSSGFFRLCADKVALSD